MATVTLILTMMLALQEAVPAAPAQLELGVSEDQRDMTAVAEREAQAARDLPTCIQARSIKRRIIAAAVRLGERDSDLMAAWAAADAIEARVCSASVAAQADGVNPLD